MGINRRESISGLAAGAVGMAALSMTSDAEAARPGEKAKMKKKGEIRNEDFYKDGVFDDVKAKEAYYEMMRRFNYPIVERLKGEDFWTLDFNTGIFTEVGMAGIFWVNHLEYNYLGHEIYLLPGQMIPEHWHVKTDLAAAKVESWQLRYGAVTLWGEGEPTPGGEKRIPPSHRECAKARTEVILQPGEVGDLTGVTERHFMVAGPEGAIVSEYATYHDMDGLRFTHPDVSL